MVWIACMTISSTSKPSSAKKPRSLATKNGIDVVLRAASPMRTRVSSAQKPRNGKALTIKKASGQSVNRVTDVILPPAPGPWALRRSALHDMLDKPFDLLVGLGADHHVAAGEKGRHGVDLQRGTTTPVFIDGIFVFAAE